MKLYETRPNFGFGAKRVILLALAILMLATPVAADAISAGGPKVTVMTRNVYLGADLSPALDATTLDGAIDGSGVIWNELLSTNFPERAVPLAREIKASGADLVGLQEVALWRQQIPSDLGAPPTGVGAPATQVKFDFLALLMQELNAIGGNYEVVHVQQEFDAELPADTDQSNATGSPPFGAELDGRLTMRDVILRKRDSKVQLTGPPTGANFVTKYTPLIAGIIPLPVNRGWNSVDATINGGRDFRFVNTHLEAFGDDTIRESQAKELFAPGGPLNTHEASRPRRGPQLRHRGAAQHPRDRPARLPGTARVRHDGQRRDPELLLLGHVRPDAGVRPHRRSRADEAGAEDPQGKRDGQRSRASELRRASGRPITAEW